MSLPKRYDAKAHEQQIYHQWETAGHFSPKQAPAEQNFVMVLPPPNANADLHIGHALDFQLKDVIGRWQRLQGRPVLMVPGADHAGFETWVVYENKLLKEGKSRFDFSREQLYQQVWDFVDQNKDKMTEQVRRLGISCDWQQFTFSLDDKIINQAYQTFKKMWAEGLIYRGKRLVSYCTKHGTSFADIEVEHKRVAGHLWQIAYPFSDSSGQIVIATTRPETLLGDVAVAVHPKDKRYQKAWGKTLKLPLTNREIPVIKDELVDRKFGTGAVKITPAHDFNDYQIGQRHKLPLVEVINSKGLMSDDLPKTYRGLSVKQARQVVLADLKQAGYLVKATTHRHNLACCYKCGTVIEPLLSEQWFVKMEPLAQAAIKQLKAGAIEFYPARKRNEIITYLSQVEDWNISRQIAWGIPIPVFSNPEQADEKLVDERVEQATIEVNGQTYQRDPDVFDTWWSSGQWPYAVFNYQKGGSTAERFYPTQLMETGVDLLRQWVSRMIMLGIYTTKQVPFEQVYFHGMVLDKQGLKMSKSRGNVINPMEIISEYGSDALRLGLIAGTSAGAPQHFGMAKVISGRNFCNKLWNIARYLDSTKDWEGSDQPQATSAADHWIIQQLTTTKAEMSKLMASYRVGEAYQIIYRFLWHDLADWHLEASKLESSPGVLGYVFRAGLKLVHPFAPFVSEVIWQHLGHDDSDMLISQTLAEIVGYDKELAAIFTNVKALVSEVRELRPKLGEGELRILHDGQPLLNQQASLISHLSRVKTIEQVQPEQAQGLLLSLADVWLSTQAEGTPKSNPAKIKQQTKLIKRLQTRLAQPQYLAKAPKKIVAETKQQLAEAERQLKRLQS